MSFTLLYFMFKSDLLQFYLDILTPEGQSEDSVQKLFISHG